MAYPRRSSRSPRSGFTLALLVLTAITVLVLDLPGTGPLDPVRNTLASALRPVRSAASAVFEPISNGWKGAFGYGDLQAENDELRRELEDRRGEEARIAQLERDNEELRKLNGIDAGEHPTKAARIISGPVTSFDQTVEIDVGSSDQVKKGMAVITGGGVLGRVATVEDGVATIDLITRSSVRIGVSTEDGDTALAQGQGQGRPLTVVGISDETQLEVGDLIYTSGIDRTAFPADLYVGTVSKVEDAADGASRTIEVEPSADVRSRYVRVVLKEAPR